MNNHRKGGYKTVVYFICLVGALGGLLFGLDQGFVANSLDVIRSVYGLDTSSAEQYAALLATGGIVGALLSGVLARYLGRKKSLVLAGFIFTVGSALSASLPPYYLFLACRFFLGFAVGVASFISPLYLSESAPASIRGSMGTLFQLMVTIGIFLISVTNVYIASLIPQGRMALLFMFLVIALFALLMLIGSLILPESPRWLMLKGRRAQAIKVIKRTVMTQEEVDEEIDQIEQTLHTDHKTIFRSILRKSFIQVLLIGVLLQMFQQLVGINVMIYYTPTIFGYVGMKGLLAKMTVPTVNMLFTFPAIYLVEKWGRKKLLYAGAIIMLVSMIVAGIAFQIISHQADATLISQSLKTVLLATFIVYIFGFAFSWGPVVWLVCAEIFPLKGREMGLTVTTIVNWTFAGLMMRYALSFIGKFGDAALFYLFAVFCIVAIIFVAFFVPETKGVTLEALEKRLKK